MKQVMLLYFHLVLKQKEKECNALQFVHETLGKEKSHFTAHHTERRRDGSRVEVGMAPWLRPAPPGTTLPLRGKKELINERGAR